MSITIRVRYIDGTRWNSNVGRYRATAQGRQVTIPNPFDGKPYEAAAAALAEKLGATLDADSETILRNDGQRRTFTATPNA